METNNKSDLHAAECLIFVIPSNPHPDIDWHVVIEIKHQSFTLAYKAEDRAGAEWMAEMLRVALEKCGTMNRAGTVCGCVGGSDQRPVRQLWADTLQIENMKLKLEISAVKSKLAEVVSIARQGRYSSMDFVAVGKRLDAMDDYLANVKLTDRP